VRLSGTEALAVRASKKLRNDELLITSLGSTILRKHLDDVPLWRGEHVAVKQLAEDFARYLYLPRVAGPEVLVQAIRDGVALLTWQSETFAYAEGHDEAAGRYRGLRAGQVVYLSAEGAGLIVKPDIARSQQDAEIPVSSGGAAGTPGTGKEQSGGKPDSGTPTPDITGQSKTPSSPRRYHGSVVLDATRVGRDAGRIADEVISHLAGLVGSEVKVTLEIEAKIPAGAPENVVRIVTENSRTLKFTNQGFESE
jgi:hypothetical protein